MNIVSHASKSAVLDAAMQVIRTKGYAATTLDDICAVAGVTKGSFFHHFKGKEEMVLEAVEHWNRTTAELFAHAAFQRKPDPRDRVLGYLDFRRQLLRGQAQEFSCLLGTLVQETFDSHPRIRDACQAGIASHARTVACDIAAAKARYAADAAWDPQVLALYTQATLQGAFILAKAHGGAATAARCIDHLRQYVANLLGAKPRAGNLKESAR
jgi:TetR/AcrR family transcriptional regulator, transcriptional repressor for nem operon